MASKRWTILYIFGAIIIFQVFVIVTLYFSKLIVMQRMTAVNNVESAIVSSTFISKPSADGREKSEQRLVPTATVTVQMQKEQITLQPVIKHQHVAGSFGNVTPEISKIYDQLQQAESRSLWSSGETWSKPDTFCSEFLLNTFDESVPVCGDVVKPTDSIKWFGSQHDGDTIGTCVLENIAINPIRLSTTKLLKRVNTSLKFINNTVVLLNDQNTSCPNPSSSRFKKRIKDYQTKLIEHVVGNKQKPSSICKHWINKLTFFFTAQKFHIYFRFLDYYNLHKSLWNHNVTRGDFLVLRISDDNKTHFPIETDHALFPEIISLQGLPNDTVCFKKVVTVPCSFESVLFRCKMNQNLSQHCFSCNGSDLPGTPFETFRQRVLQGCSADENKPDIKTRPQVGIISRTPYLRFPKDKLQKFQRILTNENDLVEKLQAAFPTANVSLLHPEQYSVCDQVRYAHKQDVLLGVHGAGLVHFWWLRKNALALELEPVTQISNPTFRMLSMLTGHRYSKISVQGTNANVTVDVNSVLNEVKKMLK